MKKNSRKTMLIIGQQLSDEDQLDLQHKYDNIVLLEDIYQATGFLLENSKEKYTAVIDSKELNSSDGLAFLKLCSSRDIDTIAIGKEIKLPAKIKFYQHLHQYLIAETEQKNYSPQDKYEDKFRVSNDEINALLQD